MDSLDLSDISDYEDHMVISSDEEIPGMEEVPYWHWTLVCLNIYFYLTKIPVIIYLTYSPLRRNLEHLSYLNALQALVEPYCL